MQRHGYNRVRKEIREPVAVHFFLPVDCQREPEMIRIPYHAHEAKSFTARHLPSLFVHIVCPTGRTDQLEVGLRCEPANDPRRFVDRVHDITALNATTLSPAARSDRLACGSRGSFPCAPPGTGRRCARAHLRSSHHQTVNASPHINGQIEAEGDVESGHLHVM